MKIHMTISVFISINKSNINIIIIEITR